MITDFLYTLHSKTFKILPLYETSSAEDYMIYVNNLKIELAGAMLTFPQLKYNNHYIDILNIINYLSQNIVDHETCKRQGIKCRDLIKKIEAEAEENDNVD